MKLPGFMAGSAALNDGEKLLKVLIDIPKIS